VLYRTMGAAMVVGAAVGLAPIAHAGTDADYISNLKQHGLSPVPGTSESSWEATAIKAAHQVCDMAAAGNTRDAITARYTAKHPDTASDYRVLVDAAVSTYCPQYW
jgi:hypothetical protein